MVDAGPGKQAEFDLDDQNSSSVSLNVDGYIILDSTKMDIIGNVWSGCRGDGVAKSLTHDVVFRIRQVRRMPCGAGPMRWRTERQDEKKTPDGRRHQEKRRNPFVSGEDS